MNAKIDIMKMAAVAACVAACDVADGEHGPRTRNAEFIGEVGTSGVPAASLDQDGDDENDAEGEVAQRPLASGSEQEPGSAPTPSGSNDFEAEQDPDPGLSPMCGLGNVALNTFNCDWERQSETTSHRAEATCGLVGGSPITGSCWATSNTHKLFRSYLTESSFNLINDGDGFSDGAGWACEWDTNATMTNQHVAMVLCCGTIQSAFCA